MFNYAPFAKLAAATGNAGFENAFTYQDYLYELLADGSGEKPITEQQWEMICDIIGDRRMLYASNSKWALDSLERKAEVPAA